MYTYIGVFHFLLWLRVHSSNKVRCVTFCYPCARSFITTLLFMVTLVIFDFIVSPYGNYTCGVICLFELNLISKVQRGNEIAALYTALYNQCGSYVWSFLQKPTMSPQEMDLLNKLKKLRNHLTKNNQIWPNKRAPHPKVNKCPLVVLFFATRYD